MGKWIGWGWVGGTYVWVDDADVEPAFARHDCGRPHLQGEAVLFQDGPNFSLHLVDLRPVVDDGDELRIDAQGLDWVGGWVGG